jgi:NAD-dependent deacetylase
MVIEVHGDGSRVHVHELRRAWTDAEVLDRVRAGERRSAMHDCNGILKSATISFGQALVPEVIDRAMNVSGEADLFSRDRLDAAGVSRGRHRGTRPRRPRPHSSS